MKKIFVILGCLLAVLTLTAGAAAYDAGMDEIVYDSSVPCVKQGKIAHRYTRLAADQTIPYETEVPCHKWMCTAGKGCTSFAVEPCRTDFCYNYLPGTESAPCVICGREGIGIHTYKWVHDPYTMQHTSRCTDTVPYPYIVCDAVQCDAEGNPMTEACTLGPVQIWRGFFRRGHRLTQTCTGCGMVYYIGFHMPDGHGDGRDPACAYCAMDTVCAEFAGDVAK